MFKSNAVRSCVELHETELRRFYETWLAFRAAGLTLPETTDPSYASVDTLGGHVLRAARNYLTWIGDCVKRPVTDVDLDDDRVSVAGKGRAFMEEVLAAWRRHLADLEDSELSPAMFKARWGDDYGIEQMLEHAIVHPMRHRVQLDRLMAAR